MKIGEVMYGWRDIYDGTVSQFIAMENQDPNKC